MKISDFKSTAIGSKHDLSKINGGRYKVTGTGSMGGRSLEDRYYWHEGSYDSGQHVCDVVVDRE